MSRRDPEVDTQRLIEALRADPERYFIVQNLAEDAGVPVNLVRRRLKNHPEAIIIRDSSGLYLYTYRPSKNRKS